MSSDSTAEPNRAALLQEMQGPAMLIVDLLLTYRPDWTPPSEDGRSWVPCQCAFHDDEHKSASISFCYNAFKCHGCGVKGSVTTLIMRQEGVSYSEAVKRAETLAAGSGGVLPPKSGRVGGRRLFSDQEPGVPVSDPGERRTVPAGVRRRTPTWT